MRRFVLLLLLMLVAPTAAMAQKYKQKAKAHSIQIDSNVKAQIMEDGLFLGNAGTSFDTTPGVHVLIISAPGHVPRQVRMNVIENSGANNKRYVTLVPMADKNTEIELDYTKAKSPGVKTALHNLPSLCALAAKGAKPLPTETMLTCTRKTIMDDLAYFGAPWLTTPAMATTTGKALAAKLNDAHTDAFNKAAEEFFSASPKDPGAINLLAYSALRRLDCNRVMELALETSAYGKPDPGLIMARGLCMEMEGRAPQAVKMYEHVASQTKPVPPAIAYQIARASLSPIAMEACVRAYADYYPCYEGAAHAYLAVGKTKEAKDTMAGYLRRTAQIITPLIADPDGHLDAKRIAAAYKDRPFSMELALANKLAQYQVGGAKVTPEDINKIQNGTLLSDIRLVRMLLKPAEAVKEPALLALIYDRLMRAYPNETMYAIKASHFFAARNRCEDAVRAANVALPRIRSGERQRALMVSKCACLVRMGETEEAKRLLRAVLVEDSTMWKAHLNLGIAEERDGNLEAALEHFQMALAGDVPPATRESIEAKIEHHRNPQVKKKETGDDAPAE